MSGVNSRKPVGRPSVASPYASQVREIFRTEPGASTAEVLRRIRLKGYAGGKTAFYYLVAALRPREEVPGISGDPFTNPVDTPY